MDTIITVTTQVVAADSGFGRIPNQAPSQFLTDDSDIPLLDNSDTPLLAS